MCHLVSLCASYLAVKSQTIFLLLLLAHLFFIIKNKVKLPGRGHKRATDSILNRGNSFRTNYTKWELYGYIGSVFKEEINKH